MLDDYYCGVDVETSGAESATIVTYHHNGEIQEMTIDSSGVVKTGIIYPNDPSTGAPVPIGKIDLYQGSQPQNTDFDVFHGSLDAVLQECEKKDKESKLPEELVEPGNWEASANKKRDEIMRRMFG